MSLISVNPLSWLYLYSKADLEEPFFFPTERVSFERSLESHQRREGSESDGKLRPFFEARD